MTSHNFGKGEIGGSESRQRDMNNGSFSDTTQWQEETDTAKADLGMVHASKGGRFSRRALLSTMGMAGVALVGGGTAGALDLLQGGSEEGRGNGNGGNGGNGGHGGGNPYQQQQRIVIVTDPQFGASPDKTDNTAEIQAAIDYASAQGGGVVFFPCGEYNITGIQAKPNVTLKGENAGASRLLNTAVNGNPAIQYRPAPETPYDANNVDMLANFWMEDLGVIGNPQSGAGIYLLYTMKRGRAKNGLNRCVIQSHGGIGVHWRYGDSLSITDCDIGKNGSHGIYAFEFSNVMTVVGGVIHENGGNGIYWNHVASNCTVFGCSIHDNAKAGVLAQNAEQPSILFCAFNRNGKTTNLPGVQLTGFEQKKVVAATVMGCLFGDNSPNGYDISCSYVESANLYNNYFYGVNSGKPSYIRLATWAKGISIRGNHWHTTKGSPAKITTNNSPNISYFLDDSGDTGPLLNQVLVGRTLQYTLGQASDTLLQSTVGDSEPLPRFRIQAGGSMEFGNGAAMTAAFGPDAATGGLGLRSSVRLSSDQGLAAASSDYSTKPLQLGGYCLWVDAGGKLRIKQGDPLSDTDGTVVGLQD
ncbi:right-handed parallel beta-helix repeat-containing protein [Paenibacillus oceani]|uniref:Right-handed parallel beta-helix repeat-containing protein n=1 Tax=Paenibacillus oceani TaxID=2772510 RepID=A0A927H1B7_9BACL|nr:right-handed parallel beta-helix repeat-containing protein [Paenibacillus oceani]MBD2864168.1 right-handed parallel beta-helix repeat-containing protein [Paenibacillus oceani]